MYVINDDCCFYFHFTIIIYSWPAPNSHMPRATLFVRQRNAKTRNRKLKLTVIGDEHFRGKWTIQQSKPFAIPSRKNKHDPRKRNKTRRDLGRNFADRMLGGNLRIECVHFRNYFWVGISHHITGFADRMRLFQKLFLSRNLSSHHRICG